MTDAETNPVGYLQEICQKYLLRFPQYEEINSVGPSHCLKFTFKCTFEGYETCSSSRTKKQAKSESAKAMVDLLKEKDYFSKINAKISLKDDCVNHSTDAEVESKVNLTDIVAVNPISAINEYCQKKSLPPPRFVETSIGGNFLCECKLGDNKTYGNGTCKKSAKTEAALKLCVQLGLKCNGIAYLSNNTEEFHSGKNPISELQELCQQNSKYLEYTTMPSVQNLFVIKCSVDSISCEGRGVSKKIAKTQAANMVLEKLMPQDVRNGHTRTEDNKTELSTLPTVVNSKGASGDSPNRGLQDFKLDSSEDESDTKEEKKVIEDNHVNLDVKIGEVCLENPANSLKNEPIITSQEGTAQEGTC